MKVGPYQIAAFTHAARSQSFSKAALVLGVTQSSVTQHVARLEWAIGTTLFVRRRSGLELTRAGHELFALSDRICTLEEQVAERIEAYRRVTAGRLEIVANASRPAMPIIAEYVKRYPGVEVSLSLMSWSAAAARLEKRDVDIALVAEPSRIEHLFVRELSRSRFAAVMRTDHPLAAKKSLSLTELASTMLVLTEDGSLTRRIVLERMNKLGLSHSAVVKMSTYPLMTEAILHGIGIGIALEDSLYPSPQLTFRPLKDLKETFRTFLVAPSDKADLRHVRSFVAVANEIYSS